MIFWWIGLKGKATMIGREEEREGKGREFRKGEREREKGRERSSIC